MTAYAFQKQLDKGEQAEHDLDAFFSQWYSIIPATRDQQRQGIDRFFRSNENGKVFSVEYKADWTALQTDNAFVETVSVDVAGKRGWAYTSTAAFLFYCIPGELCYVVRFDRLRRNLDRWMARYPAREIPNKGYKTHGILVPLREFEQIATIVYSL